MYLDIEIGQRIIPCILRVEILHSEKYLKTINRTPYNVSELYFIFFYSTLYSL